MEKTSIKNSSGKNLAAVVHTPAAASEKLAILCPGNLDSKDYTHLVKLGELLCLKGYTVVRFDPTGTSDSEGETGEYTVTQYLKDIKSVLDYMLAGQLYKEILLGGHSRGGQLSLLAAARDPRITKVLAIMPSSRRVKHEGEEEWKKTGFKQSMRDVPGSDEIREYNLPYSSFEDRLSYDVEADVKNIHVPIIFITGELDSLVLPEYVKAIYDCANKPKKFINIPGIPHSFRRNLDQIEIVNNEILKALEL